MKNNTVLAVVVLLLLAVGAFYLYKNSQMTKVPQTTDVEETTVVKEEPADEVMMEEVVVNLDAVNADTIDQSGVAVLTEAEGGGVQVAITLTTLEAAEIQPAHIHRGSCPGVGEIAYPLESVVEGKSTTLLEVTMADLKEMLPLAINVHKSADEVSVYTACGSLEL